MTRPGLDNDIAVRARGHCRSRTKNLRLGGSRPGGRGRTGGRVTAAAERGGRLERRFVVACQASESSVPCDAESRDISRCDVCLDNFEPHATRRSEVSRLRSLLVPGCRGGRACLTVTCVPLSSPVEPVVSYGITRGILKRRTMAHSPGIVAVRDTRDGTAQLLTSSRRPLW